MVDKIEADLQASELSSSSAECLTESTEDTRALLTPLSLSDVDTGGQGENCVCSLHCTDQIRVSGISSPFVFPVGALVSMPRPLSGGVC